MAMEDIFKALERQAEQDVAEMLDAAREQAAGIVEDAEAKAQQIRAAKIEAGRSLVSARTARVINAARLDSRRQMAGVKERAIANSYDDALQKLSAMRGDAGYPALFRSLAAEALDRVEGDTTVMVDPADESLAKQTMAELGASATIDTSTSSRGGLTIVANDGTLWRRNTLEDRLDKYRSAGQAAIAEIMRT
jgi:vacuolar-type H+-ATPase subunit E/Vma4